MHIFSRDVAKQRSAFCIEVDVDFRLIGDRIKKHSGVLDIFARQAAFGCFLDQVRLKTDRAFWLLLLPDHVGVTDGRQSFGEQFGALRMHHSELKKCRALNRAFRALLFLLG